MLDKRLTPSAEDLQSLVPERTILSNGKTLYLFHSASVDILKIDFIFNAGSAYQPKPLCTGIARDMMLEASVSHPASEVAELFDRLGVVIDRNMSASSVKLTVYVLRKYVRQVYPLLRDLLCEPYLETKEFDVLLSKRRQTLLTNQHKTSIVARNVFYEALYGSKHPEGRYAKPGDEKHITLEDIRRYVQQRFQLSDATIFLAGNYDDTVIQLIDDCFASNAVGTPTESVSQQDFQIVSSATHTYRQSVPACVQTTLRVGRLLPFDWQSMDYAYFLILNTILGGYFGSRLMANIREEKGYTYGINSMTNLLRDSIVFYITTDVANEVSQAALAEIYKEIGILCSEPVGDDELNLVCNYMAGDFLRSIDGIFERSERFYGMIDHLVDERFSTNLFNALSSVTPSKLTDIAVRTLGASELYEVVAGC